MQRTLCCILPLSLILILTACGDDKNSDDTNGNALPITSQTLAIKVFSDQGFVNSGFRVKTGDKFQIKPSGTVSVGLIDASNPDNLKAQTGDADGHNHWGPGTTGGWVILSGMMNFNCGIPELSVVINLRSDGAVVDIPTPVVSVGPCCSPVRRAALHPDPNQRSFANRNPLFWTPANRCVSTARFGALIMKIVPDNKIAEEIPPVFVGKHYETTAYQASSEGSLYFAVNDLIITNDNTGAFDVNLVRVP